ncbi:MAG: hypothetical protein Q8P72_06250 [Candidatus Roizmanbacteria bacterium]|nr:hypothetical protein [Candidatus Roizmanbacteria bacterium]
MKTQIGFGIIIFLQILMLLKVPATPWSRWNKIHQNPREKTSYNTAKTLNMKNLSVVDPIIIDDPIDVSSLPHKIDSWNLSEEDWRWFFTNDVAKRPLLYNGHDVSFAQLSPSHQKLGFFFYPKDHSLGEIVLSVLDIDKRVITEIYRGDTWTSNWEWKDDDAVIVRRSCGTGCMVAYVVDLQTKETIDKYRVY